MEKLFESILKAKTHGEVAEIVQKALPDGYSRVDGGLYTLFVSPQDVSVPTVVVHSDTVHVASPEVIIVRDGKVWSPQGIGGDDRAGVYGALVAVNECSVKPHFLLTDQEECGCRGARAFIQGPHAELLRDSKFFLSLDRQGARHFVTYQTASLEFLEFASKVTGWVEQVGTYSDILVLGDYFGVSGINLATGYHNPHTLKEFVVLEHLMECIQASVKLLEASTQHSRWVHEKVYFFEDYDEAGESIAAVLETLPEVQCAVRFDIARPIIITSAVPLEECSEVLDDLEVLLLELVDFGIIDDYWLQRLNERVEGLSPGIWIKGSLKKQRFLVGLLQIVKEGLPWSYK